MGRDEVCRSLTVLNPYLIGAIGKLQVNGKELDMMIRNVGSSMDLLSHFVVGKIGSVRDFGNSNVRRNDDGIWNALIRQDTTTRIQSFSLLGLSIHTVNPILPIRFPSRLQMRICGAAKSGDTMNTVPLSLLLLSVSYPIPIYWLARRPCGMMIWKLS
jgi:hypothetical protein